MAYHREGYSRASATILNMEHPTLGMTYRKKGYTRASATNLNEGHSILGKGRKVPVVRKGDTRYHAGGERHPPPPVWPTPGARR